jgi:Arc/MetJ family transcription regulator
MFLCMRTTIQLDDQLLTEAKGWAAQSGRTLKAVIEDALREALARRNAPQFSARVHLKTFRGQGVLPGVDLDDSASLLDLMERDHGPT